MATTTKGKCSFCGEVFTKTVMKRHLDKCPARAEPPKAASKQVKYFCISVQGFYEKDYWIYIDIPVNSTFRVLDDFLREIWLECCGHLSAFEVQGQTFSSYPDSSYGDRSMAAKLEQVLSVGLQFSYSYDFGSTTNLNLKVVSEYEGNPRKTKVALLARNLAPLIKCSNCAELATQVCCVCINEDCGWLCDKCSAEHECGEDMLLPVVNSPRVGVCAYCGGIFDE